MANFNPESNIEIQSWLSSNEIDIELDPHEHPLPEPDHQWNFRSIKHITDIRPACLPEPELGLDQRYRFASNSRNIYHQSKTLRPREKHKKATKAKEAETAKTELYQ